MAKNKYSATFKNGKTITRSSDRTYGAAWFAKWQFTHVPGAGKSPEFVSYSKTGFAATAELAKKAIEREAPVIFKHSAFKSRSYRDPSAVLLESEIVTL